MKGISHDVEGLVIEPTDGVPCFPNIVISTERNIRTCMRTGGDMMWRTFANRRRSPLNWNSEYKHSL